MTDEIDKTSEEKQQEHTGELPPADGSKTFTQNELERVIKERLDREKAGHTAALASKEAAVTKAAEDLIAANGLITAYQAVVQKQLDTMIKKLSPAVKDLVTKLGTLEQLAWLEKNAATLSTQSSGAPELPQAFGSQPQTNAEAVAQKRATKNYSL